MNINTANSHRGGHDDADAPVGFRQALQMISTKTWPVFLLALASASALGADLGANFSADARERGFIRRGMGEGEVLLKIGKPDHLAFHRDVRGEPEEKTWTYFPHARDPQTVTILRFHSGLVTDIRRRIAR